AGNLSTTTNVEGVSDTVYSGTNRLLSETVYQPGGTTEVGYASYVYLAAGQESFSYDGDSNYTQTVYDRVGRVTSESTYDAADDLAWTQSYSYDVVNNCTRVTNGDDSYSDYTFDIEGDVLSEVVHNAGGATVEEEAWQYNLDDEVTE